MASLGLDTYVGFYLRGFLKTRSWITISPEAQAFQLEARFSLTPPEVFPWKKKSTAGLATSAISRRCSAFLKFSAMEKESPESLWGGARG